MSSNRYAPTSEDYSDTVLFGPRTEVSKLLEYLKLHNDTECVILDHNTFCTREQWKLDNIVKRDNRLKMMMDKLEVSHAVPIQRYSWPKMHKTKFPTLCIAPEGTGKTYAYLLYIICHFIRNYRPMEPDMETSDLLDLRSYPKCLIITSTHDQAESLVRTIERMKEEAYFKEESDKRAIRKMTPIVRSISVDQQDDKLVMKSHESSILIGTPSSLIRCLALGAVTFSRAEYVIFDDVDLCLQLHNYKIQELMSVYLDQTSLSQIDGKLNSNSKVVRLFMFSRKWTELLKKFVTKLFPQRTVIFGSISEAAIFLNTRFELEFHQDEEEKLNNLIKLINFITGSNQENLSAQEKSIIVCHSDAEASDLCDKLTRRLSDRPIKLIDGQELSQKSRQHHCPRQKKEPVLLISDSVIDFEVEVTASGSQLNDITHLIHYSLPEDMLVFDQRFRLMHQHIRDERSSLKSTIFIGPKIGNCRAKQLYDLISRSGSTLRGNKSAMRDYLETRASSICWRWAAIGLCRFEKLSRDDHFGSYCSDRHSLAPLKQSQDSGCSWPSDGQVKLTLTHVISPNEFYFWFEAHRGINNINWTKCQSSGQECMRKFQLELDKLKKIEPRSLPIERIRKGFVYGVYFPQEARVDRVLLLDEPKHIIERHKPGRHSECISDSLAHINVEQEYSKQVRVIKIDYGSRVEVYVKNIFELPTKLASAEPKCHRAFHVGFKPIANEPNWHYKTKRQFYEKVTQQNVRYITAWIRLYRDKCFWMDNMEVSKELVNIDSKDIINFQPHRELVRDGLAEQTRGDPEYLNPSIRLLTIGKWNSHVLNNCAQYAFLRKDRPLLDLYLLEVKYSQGVEDIIVRQSEYNKSLIELEDSMQNDYISKQLDRLHHFAENLYCLARVYLGTNKETNETIYAINRVKILTKVEFQGDLDKVNDLNERQSKYLVICLDHGDEQFVAPTDLFEAKLEYLRVLPFQAISCKLANINSELNLTREMRAKVANIMLDSARDANENYKIVKGRIADVGSTGRELKLYLYPIKNETESISYFHPMSEFLLEKNIRLHEVSDPEYEKIISEEKAKDESDVQDADIRRVLVSQSIKNLLEDIIREELLAFGADPHKIR